MNAPLRQLLQETSRSFYLTLRILPGRVRPQIGLAYLLARTTDTIADSEIVPVELRLRALRQLRERILGQRGEFLDFGELATRQGDPAERRLLEACDHSLALLRELGAEDRERVRAVLTTIISGQELDLQRFADTSFERGIVALANEAELDDYAYRVAGCVGEFWTKLCRAHLFPNARLDEARFQEDAIRFGKGLQLVNILRDLPVDLRKGRCYVPADSLAQGRLQPTDLLQPLNQPRFQPVYQRYLDVADAHLAAGWRYTNTIPRGQVRVRLACAWPVLIGMQTLRKLSAENVLDANHRIKISRAEVRRIMIQSVLRYPWAGSWRRLGTASN